MTQRVRALLVVVLATAASLALAALLFTRLGAVPPAALEWKRGGSTFTLADPRPLAVLGLLPLLALSLVRSLSDLPWQQRVLAILFRLGFLATIALALARPARTAETRKVCTVLLLDVSDSISAEALEDARKSAQALLAAKPPDDLVKLVTFAKRPRLVQLGQGPELPPASALRHDATPPGPGTGDRASAATDIGAALDLAYAVFPPGYLKRVVLLSDGVETSGDVLAAADRARSFGVEVHAVPSRRPPPAEVAIRSLGVPGKVQIGEPFEVTADVYSSRKTKARIRLYQGEVLNGLGGVKEVDLSPGSNDVRFSSVVRFGGKVTYAAEVDRMAEDTFAANNRVTASLDVPGRPAVLYVEGQPQRANYLSSALGAQEFDVDVRAATAFPGSLEELERYDFFILSDVPAEQVSLSSQALVERYVRDLGGGFLFAGGPAGFGLGGWAHSTIERILPVRMDAEHRKDAPSVAMTLVIDRSGSMTGLPLEMAKAACRATVDTLEGDDLIEVVAFDSSPIRYVKMQPARYRTRIEAEIARIQPGGGTEIFSALDMAYQDMTVVQARRKHVILLTDGRADSQGIRDLVQAMVAESMTVTTVGLGEGADADFLRTIADTGGGRYHHVPDPNSLPRIFTRETELVSRQAAVEEWFPVTQTSSADFLNGVAIQSAPFLHGYVATQMREPPAQQILASDKDEPILARMRVGLGWTLAWTSDVKNQWATDWLRWSGFSKFWGQLVREHMRKKHRRELDMRTEMEDGRVRAIVDAFTADERFEDGLESKLTVTGPEPKGKRMDVPMRQTAPGRYEADFRLPDYGAFLLEAEHSRVGDDGALHPTGVSYAEVENPYPREYSAFEPDVARLGRLVAATGGVLDPAPPVVFDPKNEKIVYREPLFGRALSAALLVFLLDLLVRRVRIFDRKFVAKPRKRAA
ncbi:MAG TPA: VWA domain-containing protein [Polyangiaceae bacterium]|nr:VWA domain-containing protein [Polyangiaceae bacterium]